ncbi:MAG: RIP metalloprotease RseP [Thiotrichaceae bacterium]
MNFLIALGAFVITIGILVAIHEYGHFWVARKLGVKVLKFSVGFGKPLFTYTSKCEDKIEYILAAIPFGGYVKMLDEREGDDVPEELLHRAFNRQPVWKRILIVLAGPVANFIFAIFAYALTFMIGVEGVKPYVGDVVEKSPAAEAGFERMDIITGINGNTIETVRDARLMLLDEYLVNPAEIAFTVTKESGNSAIRKVDLSQVNLLKEEGDHLEQLGVKAWRPYLPAVHQVLEGKAAEKAGFKAGDKLLSGNGKPFNSLKEFSAFVSDKADKEITIRVQRGEADNPEKTHELNIDVTPELFEEEGKQRGLIGVSVGGYLSNEVYDKLHVVVNYSPFEALKRGTVETWNMSIMSLKVMGRLVTGQASLKHISGPVTIATYAGETIRHGVVVFLGFLAIISLSLGVMNLLPIPVLDGGHLLFYIVELIKGSPVSETVQEYGMRLGVVMVGAFMMLAFYNDILRLID